MMLPRSGVLMDIRLSIKGRKQFHTNCGVVCAQKSRKHQRKAPDEASETAHSGANLAKSAGNLQQNDIYNIKHKTKWVLPVISSKIAPKDNLGSLNSAKVDRFALVASVKPGSNKSLKELNKDSRVPEWMKQKMALKKKFDGGWSPAKKLDRELMKSIKYIKTENPEVKSSQLAEYFKVSPEAIRRILKSAWEPRNEKEDIETYERWKRRGERIKSLEKSADDTSEIKFISFEDLRDPNKKFFSKKQRKILKRRAKRTSLVDML